MAQPWDEYDIGYVHVAQRGLLGKKREYLSLNATRALHDTDAAL